MASSPYFSRRDFLKLAALSAASFAAPPGLLRPFSSVLCPPWPADRNRLSVEQRQRLDTAAQTFIAPNLVSARQVALDIDFIEGNNEDASTMCGPLTIAILQKAGLLGLWARPHDFWLMDPRMSSTQMQITFPPALYDWLNFETPIAEFNFNTMPLQAGDLVYLYSAPGDTFEHVFVVTRVEADGRAFTVSNFFVSDGTIIEERLLYDPQRPGEGQLIDWGDRSLRNKLGNTGSGGFDVWRVKSGRSLEFPRDPDSLRLRHELDALLLAAPGEWYGLIKQVGGMQLYQFNPYEPFHPASTIKLPVAFGFYHWLEAQQISDWKAYLSEHGVHGRTYSQLLKAMLIDSEEEATQSLVDFLTSAGLESTWMGWGLNATKISSRRSTATELGMIFEALASDAWVSAAANEQLRDYLSTLTPNDATRLGVLRSRLPAATHIFNKRGSLVDWPRVVADSALIELPGNESYLFTLHGLGKGKATYEELEATLDHAIALFGDYLIS